MLQEDFVPVAFDQWYHRRKQDTDGEFYRRIATQGPRSDFGQTTQGFYIASAGGELIHYNNNRGPQRIRGLMQNTLGLDNYWIAKPITDDAIDRQFDRSIPDGAIVVQVNAKVLGGYADPVNEYEQFMQAAIGCDNMWIMPVEARQLVGGSFTESLVQRIARFHLIDNTRGEPPMWRADEVTRAEISLNDDGTLHGRITLSIADGSRSYDAWLFGKLEVTEGRLTRFDIVVRGEFTGEGRWTRGAPDDPFPFAVAFRLADENDIAFSVCPQACKGHHPEYLRLASDE